ncbi:hypothetical protein CR513_21299, partial [Mucuna pruriens]
MYQGFKSVEEYYKDMEVALMRLNVLESMKPLWLDFYMLYHYTSLDDLVHQATQVEYQQRRRLASKKTYPNGSKSKERGSLSRGQKEEHTPTSLVHHPKIVASSSSYTWEKGHIASQCPKKRNMVTKED